MDLSTSLAQLLVYLSHLISKMYKCAKSFPKISSVHQSGLTHRQADDGVFLQH